MDRRKEPTNYNSIEALSIFASFMTIFGLVAWGLNLTLPNAPELRAKWQIKVVGYSVWQIQLNKEKKASNSKNPAKIISAKRGLASSNLSSHDETGTMGIDPWGQPYQYSIKKDKSLMFIWSKGPNLKDDSNNQALGFRDDDIGVIFDLKTRL